MDTFIISFLQDKIEELKETSGNRDVSQGGTTAGATAASAIAAMQEAAGKLSRDMIRKGYRAMVQVATLVLELIRQFYDQPRSFRITGKQGEEKYAIYTNEGIQPQAVDMGPETEMGERVPVFDIKVKAQRANPYSTMSQNELMKELYGMGMFNPQLADQAVLVLEGMQFEGKDSILQKVQQNGTMYQQLQAMQEQMAKMAVIIDAQNGTNITQGVQGSGDQRGTAMPPRVEANAGSGESSITEKARQRTAQTTSPT